MKRRAWVAGVVLAGLSLAGPLRADDAMDAQKARFEEGMSHFEGGRFQQAIDLWEPIVANVGDAKAYRILYNLGVSYDELGRATRAADRLTRFRAEVVRRYPTTPPPDDVRAFDVEAQKRLTKLEAVYGRIRLSIPAGERVGLLLDREDRSGEETLTFYVVPGAHEVTVRPGHPAEDARALVVAAGELVVIPVRPLPREVIVAPPPTIERPPFSPVWIGVAAGVSVASIAVPLVLRASALETKRSYDDPAATPAQRAGLDHDYGAARARYEVSWLVPGTLGVGTAALAATYLFAPRKKVPVSVDVGFGTATVSGRF
jgi:tetratricopeptide (TPR) repeat protein